MKDTVSGIFAKHGLNAENYMRKGPLMTGGMGRLMGSGGAGGSRFESLQSLFESLQAESDGRTNAGATAREYSNAVLDCLFGIDEEA
jgi:hypothetical protein